MKHLIETISTGKNYYTYTDKNIGCSSDDYFYKLKIIDIDGKYSFNNLLSVKFKFQQTLKLSSNLAKNIIPVNGLTQYGVVTIFNASSKQVLSTRRRTNTTSLNHSTLSSGLYYARFSNGKNLRFKKLIIE